jgi:hypothetical protein
MMTTSPAMMTTILLLTMPTTMMTNPLTTVIYLTRLILFKMTTNLPHSINSLK